MAAGATRRGTAGTPTASASRRSAATSTSAMRRRSPTTRSSLRGIPTATTLGRAARSSSPTCSASPRRQPGFGAVTRIEEEDGGVIIADADGHEVFAACDVSFVTNPG